MEKRDGQEVQVCNMEEARGRLFLMTQGQQVGIHIVDCRINDQFQSLRNVLHPVNYHSISYGYRILLTTTNNNACKSGESSQQGAAKLTM